jgi:hypothetical protein
VAWSGDDATTGERGADAPPPPAWKLLSETAAAGTGPSADDIHETIASSPRDAVTGKARAAPAQTEPDKFGPEYYDFLAPPEQPDELGRLGTYRMLRVLGAGGMGVVYEADEPALERRVAVKVLLPSLAASASARQRFLREARSAAKVEHERIVPIFRVGEDRGIPYLAMPLLKGESLERRIHREGRLPAGEVLRIGREVAEALAAAHECGLIHRDIKPGNIWLETRGQGTGVGGQQERTANSALAPDPCPLTPARVKLLDFGLARSLEKDNSPLTQQGSLVGTPAFMAPEQAAGEAIDPRCDLFSLGCVLYHISTGTLPFQGANAFTTLMAVMHRQPLTPVEVCPDVPAGLSTLVMQLLAKQPGERPASAQMVIAAIDALGPLEASPSGGLAAGGARPGGTPGGETAAGVTLSPKLTELSGVITASTGGAGRRPRWPLFAGLALAAFLVVGGALLLPSILNWLHDKPAPADAVIEIGIAYGTEKTGWFNEAVRDFAGTASGKNIKIDLIPMGSLEGGQAVARNEDQRIHVWSPASSLYKSAFVHDWQRRHPGHNPIAREESLAMTPMVFIFWEERQARFVARYKAVSFSTITQAMHEPQGWAGIGGRPEWGRLRFGHTNPTQSNSGLVTLLLMACELDDGKALTARTLADPELETRLGAIEGGLAGLSNSTGNLMREMVTKGPSAYDGVFVYESLAIEYLKAARGRWGDLQVTYPRFNYWSENPYYILDVPWSTREQRQAAEAFLTFLMSEPMQKKAVAHGFRPGNIDVPIRDIADSPFVRFKDRGLSLDIGEICPPPSPELIDALLRLWERCK